ncbi:3'-5' exonuclease [Tulasnella sp. JGI-2019a]|nr:3'-5' exonuclease [Tulasnella sp. JGI-2019a]
MPPSKKASASTTPPTKAAVSANWTALQQRLCPKNVPPSTPTPTAPKRKRKSSGHYAAARLLSPAATVPAVSLPEPSTSSGIINKMMKTLQRGKKTQPAAASSSSSSGVTRLSRPISPKPSSSLELANKSNNPAHLQKMVLGKLRYTREESKPGKYLAIDCEMVGLGPKGSRGSLARVSVVNFLGAVIFDAYVEQTEEVTDYRTKWSGIRAADLSGSHTKSFDEVQKTVQGLLTNRVLVGHAVHNDLQALMLSHPSISTRDTQRCVELRTKYPSTVTLSLSMLAKNELELDIQQDGHSSLEDARATMAIYRLYKENWDKVLPPPITLQPPSSPEKKSTKRPQTPTYYDNDMPTLKVSSSGLAIHVDMSAPPPSKQSRQRSQTSPPRPSSPRSKVVKNLVKMARTRASQQVKNTKAKGKISSGLSVIVRRRGGTKEVQRHGKGGGGSSESSKRRSRRLDAGRNGAKAASTSKGGGWWSTLS